MKQRYSFRSNAVKFRLLTLTLLALLVGGKVAIGQTRTETLTIDITGESYTYYLKSDGEGNQFRYKIGEDGSWSTDLYDYLGNVTARVNAHITIVFENEETILSTGQFSVPGGHNTTVNASITLKLGNDCTACTPQKPTLKTASARGTAWFLMANYHTDPDNKSITVLGKNPGNITTDGPDKLTETSSHWDENFVLDGGAPTMTIDKTTDTMNYKVKQGTGGMIHYFESAGGGQPFRMQQGTLTLTKVTLQNYATSDNGGTDMVSTAGVQVMTQNAMDVGVRLAMTQCHFTHLTASSGYCAVRLQGLKGPRIDDNYVKIDHCLFDHCYCLTGKPTTGGTTISENGVIRTVSNFRTPVWVTNCKLENNLGPSIRHHEPYNMVIDNNIIQDNWTKGKGGGMQLRGPATLTACKVLNNTATGDGGGIFYGTFVDGTDMNPGHSILTMDKDSEISGNKSYGNGGGIMLFGQQIHPGANSSNLPPYNINVAYFAHDENGVLYNPHQPIRVEFHLNGGTITNNTCSGQGGGVCIQRDRNCTYYGTNCYLRYGTITGNKTWGNNGKTGEGGGVALITSSDYDTGSIRPSSTYPANTPSDPNDIKPQDINVVISESGTNKVMKIEGNYGSDGGGIYVDAHSVSYNNVTSEVNVFVYDGTVAQKNIATNNGGGLYVEEGDVRIKGATFGGYDDDNGLSLGNTAGGSGGGVYAQLGNIYINYWASKVGNGNLVWALQNEIHPTVISYNTAAVNGGGVNTHAGTVLVRGQNYNSRIQITNNEATSGSGGGVFCMGLAPEPGIPPKEYIRMSNVDIIGNKAVSGTGTSASGVTNGCGGGVYLQYGIIDMNRVKIQKNMAHVNGGGINDHNGTINLAGCEIGGWDDTNGISLGNTCGHTISAQTVSHIGSGGGVYTNAGDVNLTHHTESGTLYPSLVKYNTAELNGGGLNTHTGKITVEGTGDVPIDICNNTAKYGGGGGIFCMGQQAAGSSLQTLYIDIKHANLRSNKATSGRGESDDGVSYGCGGGMYLQYGEIDATNVTMQNNFANVNGGAINNHQGFVDIWGCQVGGAEYYDGNNAAGVNKGNKAGHSGGGIFTRLGNVDVEDYVEYGEGAVRLYESGINHNEAGENGGGINTHSGTITINDDEYKDPIEVTYNMAKKGGAIFAYQGTIIAHNAIINNNTATDNGGAINNHTGDITLYGGELNNNTSESGKGGGAYTNLGDVRILPYPKLNNNPTVDDGTKIFNNIARGNGGGINNHTGRVDIRYATIYNNTSSLGSGGGIYCEGPHSGSEDGLGFTIRLLNSDLFKNKTRGADGTDEAPTGRGGGIYLAFGSIFAQNSNIVENSANINGGGLDNRDGSILIYGCNLLRNRAVTRSGGGIYTEQGDITTGPCTVPNPDNANATLSKATVVQQNIAKVNGGGINNHNGNIYLNGDLIGGFDQTGNVSLGNMAETGHGGGIYIKNGVIDMYGGKIAHNEAAKGDGGGVWSGGGTFNIQKRQGKPVIQIIDIEDVKKTDGADTWEAWVHYHLIDKGDNNATVTHGIRYAKKTESFGSNNDFPANPLPTDPDHKVGETGCYRFRITGLDGDNTKYKVEAYASYPDGSTPPETIEGVSSITYFETFTAKPTVITGNATSITQNSAELSGKVIHAGTTDVTECGFYWGTTDNPTTRVEVDDALDYFDYVLEGLDPNTTYYFKAFAKNSTTGTTEATGEVISFKTTKAIPVLTGRPSVPNIDSTFATFTYTIPDQASGSPNITRRGFVWSTDDDPDPREDFSVIVSGTGGAITYTLSGANEERLEPSTCYYVRAYAGYDASSHDPRDYAFSEPNQFFTTDIDATKPVVRAIRISDITQHSAVITGKIVQSGQTGSTSGLDNIQMYGVCYSSTNAEPTEHNETNCTHVEFVRGGTGFALNADSTFTIPITYEMLNNVQTQMAPQTTYYVRMYATSVTPNPSNGVPTEAQIAYSNDYNFTTLPLVRPTAKVNVENMQIVDPDKAQANFIGTYTEGGSTYTKYGVRYGLASAPNVIVGQSEVEATEANPITSDTYQHTFNDLDRGTLYWAEAYVITVYSTTEVVSDRVTFTTPVELPTLAIERVGQTEYVSTSQEHKVTIKHKVTSLGDNEIKHYGVVYSTLQSPLPTIGQLSEEVDDGFKRTDASITTTPSENNFELRGDEDEIYSNRYYYIRPWVSTKETLSSPAVDNEYIYGDDYVRVLTLPNVIKGDAVVRKTNANLIAEIGSNDGNYHLRKYGLCWVQDDGGTAEPNVITNDSVMKLITGPNYNHLTFNLSTTTLESGKQYRWRAYVINEEDNIAYSYETGTFTTYNYAIAAVASPSSGGSITESHTGTGWFNNGEGYYNGGTVTLEAMASTGYTWSKWTKSSDGSDYSSNPTITFDASDEPSLIANFTPNNYAITFSFTNGTVTLDGISVTSGTAQSLTYDQNYELVATPATGYHFVAWKIGDEILSTNANFIYTVNVTAATTINAVFEVDPSGSRGNNHPRDIYPAPAREPWDWDDDFIVVSDTLSEAHNDTIAALRTSLNREAPVAPQDIPEIIENKATEGKGGGIYMTNDDPEHPTKLVFSGPTEPNALEHGRINFNYAGEAGGGIYINEKAYMQMKGYSEVNGNHVPVGKLGGGIYLAGRLYVGDKNSDVPTGENPVIHALRVNMNYATNRETSEIIEFFDGLHSDWESELDRSLNNIFLPVNDYDFDRAGSTIGDDDNDVITLLSDISGKDSEGNNYTSLGFNVVHGFCPVIATSKSFGGDYVQTQGGDPGVESLYESWLAAIMPSSFGSLPKNGAIFEDTETYIAIHTTIDSEPFRAKYIYLWGSWTNPAVSEDPEVTAPMKGTGKHYKITNSENTETAGTGEDQRTYIPGGENMADPIILEWEIYSEEGLSWFSSYVNGLNAFTKGDTYTTIGEEDHYDTIHRHYNKNINPYAKAKLMNNLDMSRYFWVPIGSVTKFNDGFDPSAEPGSGGSTIYTDNHDHQFKGEFDGQGNIIKGLDCRYLTGVNKYGLFGELASDPEGTTGGKSAVVKNVFVDDSKFISDKTFEGYRVGGIAGVMSGTATLSGAEARSHIDVTRSDKTDTYVGGLVGKMEGTAVVHSSMAMPEIIGTAGYMGGLVGRVGATNKLLNSFANPKFPNAKKAPYYNIIGSGKFIGGLVGENNGIVENCYTRLQGDEPTDDGVESVFGWFAGTNTVQANPDSPELPNMGGIRYCYAPDPDPENPDAELDYVKAIAYVGTIVHGDFGVEEVDPISDPNPENPNPGCKEPFGHGKYTETERVSGKYGFKHRDHRMTAVEDEDAIYIVTEGTHNKTNDTLIGGLQHALNGWVKASGNGWKLNEGTGQYYNENDYAVWSRTMASPINDDYPVLMLEDFNALGSEDSIYLHYKHNVDDLIDAYSYTKIDHEKHPTPSIYLYDTVADGMENGKPKPVPIKKSNIVKIGGKDVMFPMLAINEDVGILQNVELMARTGVTIRNNRKGNVDFTDNPNWHLFSSSVKAAPIGLEYHTRDNEVEPFVYNPPTDIEGYGYTSGSYNDNIPNKDKHPHEVWVRRKYWDPPKTTWYQTDDNNGESYDEEGDDIGYFPTNTPYGTWRPGTSGGHVASAADGFFDLYVYSEFYYHWINYKREGIDDVQDHWHWDKDAGDSNGNGKGEHYRIGYTAGEKYINDTEWKSGKGYLMALSSESMMMADGLLNNSGSDASVIEIDVTNTPIGNNLPPNGHGSINYSVPWRSLNLIGNPYQSYLDFDEFVKANGGGSDLSEKNYCYAVIDDSKSLDVEDRYIYYTTKQSDNPVYSASQFIHPHQGFFVKVAANGNLKFNNTMRVAGKTGVTSSFNSPYRSQVNYPLVNLLCYDEDGRMDLTTVEVNRPEFGGGHKMEKLHESKGLIYAHLENESFQTLFTPVGTNVVPVRFIPNEDGMFTLNWNTLHGEFSYLHLIDNITGVDVDCLTNDEYKFEGKTSDYKSRFKLVFRCDGDEPEDPEEPDNPDDGEDSDHFAFMFGDELVVNGEGMLQMFDVQGRCLMETQAVGQQSSHSLPRVAAGVYMFRLTGDKRVKVQKMVIK